MLPCVFSETNQKITESYTIWSPEVDAERREVTPGVEFRKVVLGVHGTVALAADTKE